MSKTFQKREICLLDVHNRIEKKHIDDALKKRFQIVNSKIEKRVNVEFKNSSIAREVQNFLQNKELIYSGKPFKFALRGNRFIIDGEGIKNAPFDEIRDFFSNYGEVNNVYYTKKYFATLASIGQAVQLVEKIGSLIINGCRVEIKYAFDKNIGNSYSNNKNFAIKTKDESKFQLVNSTDKKEVVKIELSQPINIILGDEVGAGDKLAADKSNLNGSKKNGGSKMSLNNNGGLKANSNGGSKNNLSNNGGLNASANGQQQQQQVANKRTKNKKSKSESIDAQRQNGVNPENNNAQNLKSKQQQQTMQASEQRKVLIQQVPDTKVNTLKSNPSTPLFAKGPDTAYSGGFNTFNSLNKLNFNGPEFKSTDYLENKLKQPQVHTTTTYFTAKPTPVVFSDSASKPSAPVNLKNDKYHFIASDYPRNPETATNNEPKNFNSKLPPVNQVHNTQNESIYKKVYNNTATNSNRTTANQSSTKPKDLFESATPTKVNYFPTSNKNKKDDKKDSGKKDEGCIIN